MDEEFVDDENPYNEKAREDQLDNEELDSSEAGFIKGYDEANDEEVKAEEVVEEPKEDKDTSE